MAKPLLLGFSDKLFPAFGAGDSDLSLATGDPDGLVALGAIEMLVLPVLDPIQDHQKPPVFPVTLIGVPGEAPEKSPKHQDIGKGGQDQGQTRGFRQKYGDQREDHAGTQDHGVQFVRAVTAHHKPLEPHTKFTHAKIFLAFNILLLLYGKTQRFQRENFNVHELFTLAVLAQEEQSQCARAGMGADHRAGVADVDIFYAVFLFDQVTEVLGIFQALAVADEGMAFGVG